MFTKIQRIPPVLYIFIIWFLFSSPYFIKHNIPYPAKLQVSFFGPWNSYPQYQGPVKNGSLTDVVDEIYPWKYFTITELKHGQFPFWNPNSFSGNPHFANYQTAVLSPFTLLFFILPFVDAWALLILFQPLFAGIFTYMFTRSLDISKTGSLIASIAFMFCGFIVCWMAWGTLGMAIAFLPLCLYSIEKYTQTKKRLYLLLLPIGIIVSFFSGHFQTSLYLGMYVICYILFKFIQTKNVFAVIQMLLFLLAGFAVTLVQIIPTLQLYELSIRSQLFTNSDGIPWYYLITVIAPDFFGNPVTRNNWIGSYAEWAGFVGLIPLVLSFVALQETKKRSTVICIFILGLLALVFSLNSPLLNILQLLKIPVFATSIPSRIIVIFSFSMAILAGFGLDVLVISLKKKSYKSLLLPFGIMGILFFVVWVILISHKILSRTDSLLAIKNFILPTLLFFVTVGLIILCLKIKNQKLIPYVAVVLLILTSLDSFRFAQKWMPFDPANLIFPNIPVIQAMQRDRGQGRVYGDYLADIDTYYQIPSIQGYDPLYSKTYGELLETSRTGSYSPAIRSVVKFYPLSKYADRLLDILGVTLIFEPKDYKWEPWAYPVWLDLNRYPLVYSDTYFTLYANKTALPRATLFPSYQVIPNGKQLLKTFYSSNFDYRHVLLLQTDPHLKHYTTFSGHANLISYTPNTITIIVTAAQKSLLFLSDNYYPSWSATVNGRNTPIYKADYTFRAIVVPSGRSVVKFYYNGAL